MTYTDMIQALDKKYGYNSKATTPIRKLNEVWEIVIQCDSFVRMNKKEKVYATTSAAAEKKANIIIRNHMAMIEKYNAKFEEKCRYCNKHEGDTIYSEEYIEEGKVHVITAYINVTDRDDNKRTIIIK